MKKLKLAALAVVAGFACSTLSLAAQTPLEQAQTFKATTEKLDMEGLSFSYQNLTTVKSFLSKLVTCINDVMNQELKNKPSDDTKQAAMGLAIIEEFINLSGIMNIEAFGSSLKKNSDTLFVAKQMFYAPKAKQNGIIWNTFGRDAHELDTLKLIPENALVAFSTDLNADLLFSSVVNAITKHIPEAVDITQGLQMIEDASGISPKKVLESVLSVSFYVDCAPGKPQLVPSVTSAALIVEVKDDSLFRLLRSMTAGTPSAEPIKPDEILSPLPPFVNVTQSGKWLIVASDIADVKNRIAGKTPNLTADKDFIAYSKGLPKQANSFLFISGKLEETLINLFKAFVPQDEVPAALRALEPLAGILTAGKPIIAVQALTPNGLFSQTHAGSDILLLFCSYGDMNSSLASVAFLSGMLLPALNKARTAAREVNCASQLKQLLLSCYMYAEETEKFPDKIGAEGIQLLFDADILTDPNLLVCPTDKSTMPGKPNEKITEDTLSYAYIGAGMTSKNSPNSIILFDKPGALTILAGAMDGSVRTVKVNAPFETCEATARMLNASLEKSAPKDFQKLIENAKALDKKLGLAK